MAIVLGVVVLVLIHGEGTSIHLPRGPFIYQGQQYLKGNAKNKENDDRLNMWRV